MTENEVSREDQYNLYPSVNINFNSINFSVLFSYSRSAESCWFEPSYWHRTGLAAFYVDHGPG